MLPEVQIQYNVWYVGLTFVHNWPVMNMNNMNISNMNKAYSQNDSPGNSIEGQNLLSTIALYWLSMN